MRTNPTLTQSPTTYNLATDLETAAWIMATAGRPQLCSVELWEHDGAACINCEFINERDYRFDVREYVKIKQEQPEVFRQTVAAGLAQLTASLNLLLAGSKKVPALNTQQEACYV